MKPLAEQMLIHLGMVMSLEASEYPVKALPSTSMMQLEDEAAQPAGRSVAGLGPVAAAEADGEAEAEAEAAGAVPAGPEKRVIQSGPPQIWLESPVHFMVH